MKHPTLLDALPAAAPAADQALPPLLRHHFQNPGDCPPPRVLQRAGEGALRALDLLNLTDQRPSLKDTMASLSQHITALAAAARVSFKEIATILRLPPDAESSVSAARAWAWLASTLGLGPEEVDMRLRWGFAFSHADLQRQRSRARPPGQQQEPPPQGQASPEALLRAEEMAYPSEQRRDLDALRSAARSVFDSEEA